MVGLIRKRCIRLKVAVAVAHHDSGVIVGVTVKVAKRPSSFMALWLKNVASSVVFLAFCCSCVGIRLTESVFRYTVKHGFRVGEKVHSIYESETSFTVNLNPDSVVDTHVYTLCLKKVHVYHPTTNYKFNNCCPISIILWYEYYWVTMPLNSGLISHLTCLMYIPYLGKLNTLEIMNLASNGTYLQC